MDTQQLLIALAAGLPSVLVGYLGYRRATKVDAMAAQAGASSDSQAGTAQVIDGLNKLVDNLQEDNRAFREDVRFLTSRITDIISKCDETKKQLSALQRKHGENGT